MASIGRDAQPDLALVHASSVHGAEFEMVVPWLKQRLPSLRTIFGCSGFGVIGGSDDGPVEVEGEPAFSLTLGQLPGVNVQVLHTLRSSIPGEDASPEDWAQFVGVPHDAPGPTSFILFADPRFAQVRDLVAGLDYAFPDAPKIGSILSSGTRSKSRAMWAWSADRGASGGGRAASSPAVSRTRRSSRQTTGLRGGRSRGSAGGALFGNDTEAVAAAVLAVMKPGVERPNGQEPPQAAVDDAGSGAPDDGASEASSTSSAASADSRATSSKDRAGGASSPSAQPSAMQGSGAGAAGAPVPDIMVIDDKVSGQGSSRAARPGLFGSLLSGLMGGRAASGQESPPGAGAKGGDGKAAAPSPAQALSQGVRKAVAALGSPLAGSGPGAGSSQAQGPDTPSSGLYLYGAVLLALQGDVQLDVVTSMGYRAPSSRIWRITTVSDSNNIVSIMPEELAEVGRLPPGTRVPTTRAGLLSRDDDSDDDDDSDGEGGDDGPEVQAITAVVDMLDGLSGSEEALVELLEDWEELLDTAVVAIAADNSKPAADLGPNDWELLPLQEVIEDYGVLVVGDPPVVGGGVDLRRGNRMRLMIRDATGVRQDLRDCLLAYKRRDLGAMLEGRQLPPTFGGLLFTDVDRGVDCYQEPHFESRTTHGYVPAPISGVFGGAQIGPLSTSGRSTAILEYASVVGVLRAAQGRRDVTAVKREAAQRAAVIQEKLSGGSSEPLSGDDRRKDTPVEDSGQSDNRGAKQQGDA